MKIRIVSDLHIEFGYYQLPVIEDEKSMVLVLAGDCHVNTKLIRPIFIQKTNEYLDSILEDYSKRFKYILYVFGNHENYSSSIDKLTISLREKIKELNLENVIVMDNKEFILDDVRFLGGTLWTDFNNRDPLTIWDAQQKMNDYRHIRIQNYKRKFSPADALRLHDETKIFFKRKLKESFNGKTMIISHHAPSEMSILARFKHCTLANGCYFTNLEEFILDNPINYWIHGHMHNSSDYLIGDCRVVCNPKGYQGDENIDYNPKFIIDTDDA